LRRVICSKKLRPRLDRTEPFGFTSKLTVCKRQGVFGFGTNRLIFPVTTVANGCNRLSVSTTTTTKNKMAEEQALARRKKKLSTRRKIAIIIAIYTHLYFLKNPVRTSICTGEIFTKRDRMAEEMWVDYVRYREQRAPAGM
jgi:hypothetical protein